MTKAYITIALQLFFLLGVSLVEHVVIFINSLVKNLLTKYKTKKKNKLDQVMKNLLIY